MNAEELKAQILNDFSFSSTFKNIIKSFDDKDTLDALKDTALLLGLIALKFTEKQIKGSPMSEYLNMKTMVLNNASASIPLCNAIRCFDDMDVLDAIKDAAILFGLMNQKFEETK